MSFRADNADYEAWLRTQCAVVESDLKLKGDQEIDIRCAIADFRSPLTVSVP